MTARRRDGGGCPVMEWIRNHPELDSLRFGMSVTDIDAVVHRYMCPTQTSNRDRGLQEIMFVEIKRFAANVEFAQRDTLRKTNLCIRSLFRRVGGVTGARCRVEFLDDGSQLNWWGIHRLRCSGSCPQTSEWIEWDRYRVSPSDLAAVLRFDKNPYSLKDRDKRRRRRKGRVGEIRQQSMFMDVSRGGAA